MSNRNIIVKDEEEEAQSLNNFILSHLDKFFVDHIPIASFADMQPAYMYTFGTVAYAAAAALFIYYTVTSYNATLSQAFISLTNDAGTCSTVPISTSSSFLADNEGNWVGTSSFNYYLALYSLTLNGFSISSISQYNEMMNYFQTSVNKVGQMAKTGNLAFTIVLWSSYVEYYSIQSPGSSNFTALGSGQLQYFQMTGSPSQIFDLEFQSSSILSMYGYCPVGGYTTYDRANAAISVTLDYNAFASNAICMAALSPKTFGYGQTYDKNNFPIQLEVESFITATAVNLGVMSIDDLLLAQYLNIYVTLRTATQNVTYQVNEYFDVRYNTMTPIVCLRNVTAVPASIEILTLCVVNIASSVFALPVFNHYGNAASKVPAYCDCKNKVGSNINCDYFNFLSGYVVYNFSVSNNLFNSLLYLGNAVAKAGSYMEFNRQAYNASFAAAAIANNYYDPILNTTGWLRNAFQFCNVSDLSGVSICSLVVFNSYDYISRQVSDYHYYLNNGSCSNSLSISSDNWAKMVNNPPAQFSQNYYSCYPLALPSFQTAVGIASGNTTLSLPVLVFMVLPIIYFFMLKLKQIPPPEEFKEVEKRRASEVLSILLLRLRDRKTRGFKKKGLLPQLYREIAIAAAEDIGRYSDSDDESDDEDDEEFVVTRRTKKPTVAAAVEVTQKPTTKHYSKDESPDSDDDPIDPPPSHPEEEKKPADTRVSFLRKRASQNVDATAAKESRRKSAVPGLPSKMSVFASSEENKAAAQKSEGIFSYFFGSSSSSTVASNNPSTSATGTTATATTTTANNMIELVVHGGSASSTNPMMYLSSSSMNDFGLTTIERHNLPSDVLVLNKAASLGDSAREVSVFVKEYESVETLVSDLLRTFSNLVVEVTGVNSKKFVTAVNVSEKLKEFSINDFVRRDDRAELLSQLSNVMCMHASIMFQVSMQEVTSTKAGKIAYNIGGQFLTLQALVDIQ